MSSFRLLLGTAIFLFTIEPGVQAAADDVASPAHYGTFGIDENGRDQSIRPGEDFYGYVNGNWARTTMIPADRPAFGIYSQLNLLSQSRVRAILDEARTDADSKIGRLYASFMDEGRVDALGAKPVQPRLRAISSAPDRNHLAGVMGDLMRIGVSGMIDISVDADARQPDRAILSIEQGGLGLPDRDYYLQDNDDNAQIRLAYLAYLTKLFDLSGISNARTRAIAVMAFETRLAQTQWSEIQVRDQSKTYNRASITQLPITAPGLDWPALMTHLHYADQATVILSEPSAIAGEAKLLRETPLGTLKDYFAVRLLDRFAPYLSQSFVNARFEMYGKALGGAEAIPDRWKRGAQLVTDNMDDALSQVYVTRYFPPRSKQAVVDIATNIKAAFAARIKALDWMSATAKTQALAKLAAVRIDIGYPDEWRDYRDLTIRADDLAGNVARAQAWRHEQDVRDLHQPTDRKRWALSPSNANALSDPTLLRIEFPAAIMQPPFFDPQADLAVNYGAIGETIAHELSHQFDDQGRKHDAHGVLTDWWQPQDVSHFTALADRLIAQYDAYQPVPGLHVKGRLTLSENIADLGGLSVAYDAYHLALAGHPAPIIGNFTGDQRFYLAFAQAWRFQYHPAALRRQIENNVHAPAPERVKEVRNEAAWYNAFNVKPGDTLYLPPEQRVKIW